MTQKLIHERQNIDTIFFQGTKIGRLLTVESFSHDIQLVSEGKKKTTINSCEAFHYKKRNFAQ